MGVFISKYIIEKADKKQGRFGKDIIDRELNKPVVNIDFGDGKINQLLAENILEMLNTGDYEDDSNEDDYDESYKIENLSDAVDFFCEHPCIVEKAINPYFKM